MFFDTRKRKDRPTIWSQPFPKSPQSLKHANCNASVLLNQKRCFIRASNGSCTVLIKLKQDVSFPKWERIINNTSGYSLWTAQGFQVKFLLHGTLCTIWDLHFPTWTCLPKYHGPSCSAKSVLETLSNYLRWLHLAGWCDSHSHCLKGIDRKVHPFPVVPKQTLSPSTSKNANKQH